MNFTDLMASGVRRAGRVALDALLPPQCLGCREGVGEPGQLCAACWSGIGFIAAPYCACCGLPFELDAGPGLTLCAACIAEPPAYARARAVFRYDAASRDLVLRFKHGDRTDAAPAFARWLHRAGADLVATADLIAPVPLHRWRLLHRRYNQSALLALELGRLAHRPVVPDLLVRRRATGSQGGLGRRERLLNVRGAFAVRPRHAAALAGRRVLLVDDVLTTGATAGAVARALRRAGASHVDVVALARVVRPATLAI
jgi:ComF family protein